MPTFSRVRSRLWHALCVVLLTLTSLATPSAMADITALNPAVLVEINNPANKSSEPTYLSTVANQLIFGANDGSPGVTLWTSDGTTAGTFRLQTITPVSKVVMSGGIGFFTARDAAHGAELWRTDGTINGTQLVKDLNPGAVDGYPHELLDVNGILYFVATTPDAAGLWKSDGTTTGTVPITPLPGDPRLLTKVQNRIYFVQGDSPADLWVSDGTANGTQFVKQITAVQSDTSRAETTARIPIDPPFDYLLTEFNNKLFFRAADGVNGLELWQSDGTPAGTTIVTDVKPGVLSSEPFHLTKLNGKLFFTTAIDGLWQTDGTAAGTTQVRGGIAYVGNLYAVGSTLYFTAYTTEQGTELWRSDGTFEGTTLVKELIPGPGSSYPSNFTELKGKLFFSADGVEDGVSSLSLWQSDGTAAGTMPIDNNGPYAGLMQVANGRIFYSGYDPLNGIELWSSDGTAGGTGLVRDINTQKFNSNPTQLTAVGNRVFFIGFNNQVWVSDGTAEGTTWIEQMGYAGDTGSTLWQVVNNDLYVVLNSNKLWWIDGAATTPTLLTESQSGTIRSLAVLNNQLFFLLASSKEQERGLWQSDGTVAGTRRIKALPADSFQFGDYAMIAVNNLLYFSVYTEEAGQELWKSDGTEAGTMLLKDINPGMDSALPVALTDVNGTLFFQADDGTHGWELWKSDGSAAGTVLVKDIFPGSEDSGMDWPTVVNGQLFFISNHSNPSNYELWVSDGTDAGTHLVKDIHPTDTTQTFAPIWLTAFNDKLLFVANDGSSGQELWISDGTEAGTQLVRDINLGLADAAPDALTHVAGVVLFAATDGNGQRTLWRSDGTAAGTQSIQAITPLANLYNRKSRSFVLAGDNIFFGATADTMGYELWKIPLTGNSLMVDTPALVGAPSGGVVRIHVDYGNQSNTPQSNSTLTVTLDERLTYMDSTGPVTPTITANTLVWPLADLGVLSEGELDLRVQTPADPLGTRYPITITLAAGPAGSGAIGDTSTTIEVMIADQHYLPLVAR